MSLGLIPEISAVFIRFLLRIEEANCVYRCQIRHESAQFADIKAQGQAIINLFTEDKIITERYWPEE